MKRLIPVLLLPGLLLLAACTFSSFRRDVPAIEGLRHPAVHFVVDNTRELPTAGTFDWGFAIFRVANSAELDLAGIDQRLHDALLERLTKQGFVKTGENPEFLVSYALADGDGLDESVLNQSYDSPAQPPPRLAGGAGQPLHYRRGALIVDVAEAKTKRLLWRGAILAEIKEGLNDEPKQARCRGAVNALLAHFPKP